MRGNLSYSPLHYGIMRIYKACAIAQTWNAFNLELVDFSMLDGCVFIFFYFSYCGKFSDGKYSALYYTLTMLQMRNCRRCYQHDNIHSCNTRCSYIYQQTLAQSSVTSSDVGVVGWVYLYLRLSVHSLHGYVYFSPFCLILYTNTRVCDLSHTFILHWVWDCRGAVCIAWT